MRPIGPHTPGGHNLNSDSQSYYQYFGGTKSVLIKTDTTRTLTAVFCECLHRGMPGNGSLEGDVTRPAMEHTINNAGTIAQYACAYYLHEKIRGLASSFYAAYNVDLELNDFSRQHGGAWPGQTHGTHQNGLNADINYNGRTDDQVRGLLTLISGLSDLTDFRMPSRKYNLLYPNGGAPTNLLSDPGEHCIHIGLVDPDGSYN